MTSRWLPWLVAGCALHVASCKKTVEPGTGAPSSAAPEVSVAPPPLPPPSAEPTVEAPPPPASASAAEEKAPKPPTAKVVTIGMHVAGGPYDEATKQPMKRSVEPRFDELARCFDHVPTAREVDAGVDLMIEAGGGRAKVSNPRTTVRAEGFLPCVVAFFESVEFEKPLYGRTGVSYSVRFKRLP